MVLGTAVFHILIFGTSVSAFGLPSQTDCARTCDPSEVVLSDHSQWEHEDGFWLGEYSYFDGNGDPVYEAEKWNYPYNHYKGFITGSVDAGSYSQRNVFLYPPQTSTRCALNDVVAFDGDTCGLNGGIKKYEADQTTQECNTCQEGSVSGPYNGLRSTTELVGAGNALLYQLFETIDGVETLRHSQLTTITTLANGSIHRTRTAQLFSPEAAGKPGAPTYASFYRETKVSGEVFFEALTNTLADWNVSDVAVGKICYGGIDNLKQFLEGGRTWPVADKYECPAAPVVFRIMRWTATGAGKYPDTFGRTTIMGELVSAADISAAAGVGAGLSPSSLTGYGWWEDAVLVWTTTGAGKYPDTFGRTTVMGELVSAADISAAAGVGAGLSPSSLTGYGWWAVKVLRWTATGAGKYPDTFGRTTVNGELVTAADITAAASVGSGNLTPTVLIGYLWWEVVA